ncbi:sensor histidine kinase [Actinomadura oligospora]|uniref:sensor histidine kinase n=1 Tax=Actinomadura oligospora TaxID=111804 RepID=UPI0004AE325B|nr:HAMP domain-containing sensor histidine kinase [Actinomadura oligospora]
MTGAISADRARAVRAPWRLARRLARRSLRARILLLTVSLLAVGLLVSNAVVLAFLRVPLVDRVDGQLRSTGQLMARVPPGVLRALRPGQAGGLSVDLVSDLYVAYVSPGGEVTGSVRAGAHRQGPAPVLPRLDSASVAARANRPFETPSRGGHGWRALVLPTTMGDGSRVVVAASLAEVDATLDRVRRNCLAVAAVTLALLTLLGRFAVAAGLRPLRRIEETSAAIADGDLSRRVPDFAAPGTEIGRLSTALNGMLARIETAVAAQAASEARMRRFVADAGHELRTPLAGITGFTDLYRMGALDGRADVDHTMDRIEREAVRLSRLVEDLLLLAHLDEHAGTDRLGLRPAPLDLRALAADALHDLRALAPTREVRVTGPGGGPAGPAPALGDERRLRQIVVNLIGNAVAHTPEGTPVRIGVGTEAGRAVLEVEDKGPGLSPEQTGHVFERFYRADGSRSRAAGGGSGLGLAIAQSLAHAHDGTLEVRSSPGEGALFRLTLPLHTPTPVT